MKFIHRLTIAIIVLFLFTIGTTYGYNLAVIVGGAPEKPQPVEGFFIGLFTELLICVSLLMAFLLIRLAYALVSWVITGKFYDIIKIFEKPKQTRRNSL